MTIGPGTRSGRRDYPYGHLKRTIIDVLADGRARTCIEIATAVQLPRHIVARNLAALTSRGILKNVGTRTAALYVRNGEGK